MAVPRPGLAEQSVPTGWSWSDLRRMVWALLSALVVNVAAVWLVTQYARHHEVGHAIDPVHLSYLEDRQQLFDVETLDWVPFVRMERSTRNVGYSQSAHWLKIETAGFRTTNPPARFLSVASVDVRSVTFFGADASGQRLALLHSQGTAHPEAMQGLNTPVAVFDLAQLAHNAPVLYVRVESPNAVYLRPWVWTDLEMAQYRGAEKMRFGVLLGIMLFATLSCLVWLQLTRDPQFFWLLTSAPLLLLAELSGKGLAFLHLWSYWPYLADRGIALVLTLFLASYAMLTGRSIDLDQRGTALARGCRSLAAACAVLVVWLLTPWAWLAAIAVVHVLYALGIAMFVGNCLRGCQRRRGGAWINCTLQCFFGSIVALRMVESVGQLDWAGVLVPMLSSDLFSLGCVALAVFSLHTVYQQQVVQHLTRVKVRKNLIKNMEAQLLTRSMELEDARKASEQMVQQQRHFLAVMGHELRSPLSATIAMTRLLRKDAAIARQAREDIATVERLSRQLLTIVDDGLAFVRDAPDRRETPAPVIVDMRAFSSDLEKICQWMAQHHRNAFVHTSTDRVPAALRLHEQALRQVCVNLITNAGRYCEDGTVTTRLDYTPIRGTQNGTLVLQVADTGEGIAPAKLADLFKPYQDSQHEGGWGLGLSIVQDLVVAHGGRITVQSVPHRGTTFTVEFPSKLVLQPAAGESTYDDTQPAALSVASAHAAPRALTPDDAGENAIEARANLPVSAAALLIAHQALPTLRDLAELARHGRYTEMDAWLTQAQAAGHALPPEARMVLTELQLRLGLLDFEGIRQLAQEWELGADPGHSALP